MARAVPPRRLASDTKGLRVFRTFAIAAGYAQSCVRQPSKLWRRDWKLRTPLLWLTFFQSLVAVYLNWTPAPQDQGLAVAQIALIAGAGQLGGIGDALLLMKLVLTNSVLLLTALGYGAACIALSVMSTIHSV